MRKDIKDKLISMADEKYRDFSKALIPDSKPLLGVRLPMLRKMAKEIVKAGDWENTFDENEYFEEVMLEAMVTGYGVSREDDLEKAKSMLDGLVPQVDNWSVCDSLCVSYDICGKYPEEMYQHIKKYIYSDKEFEVRVGLILLLDHYVKLDRQGKKMPRKRAVGLADIGAVNDTVNNIANDTVNDTAKGGENNCADMGNTSDVNGNSGKYTQIILEDVNRPFNQGYYAQMAAAWLLAECFVTFPKAAYEFLKSGNKLDDFTYNKALQKICESRIPDDDVKNIIRSMKRKSVGK